MRREDILMPDGPSQASTRALGPDCAAEPKGSLLKRDPDRADGRAHDEHQLSGKSQRASGRDKEKEREEKKNKKKNLASADAWTETLSRKATLSDRGVGGWGFARWIMEAEAENTPVYDCLAAIL